VTSRRPVTRRAPTPLVVTVGTLATLAMSGCGGARTVGATVPRPVPRDQLLRATGDAVWRGDLPAAEAALAQLADRERGVPDTALDFWSDLLALLRCEPLKKTPQLEAGGKALADPWERLRRLVQIERLRLGRQPGMKEALPPTEASTKLTAAQARREQKLVWPVENERWNDELPLPAFVTQCAPADAVVAGRTPAPDSDEAALVAATAGTLPSDHPAVPLLLMQTAVVSIARGDGAAAGAPLARLERLGARLPSPDGDERTLAAALAAIADPATPPEEVLVRGWAALAVAPTPEARRDLQLVISDRLADRGRREEATAVRGPPPHGDDQIGRYLAFRQVESHAAAGRRAELLAEARDLLHDRNRAAVAADPALQAVMDVALRTLLASPVTPETMELLEAFGPPRERVGRAEAFGRLALETGAYPSALTTFSWLYENDTDRNRRLQHLARATVAAARASDRVAFARNFRTLAGQEQKTDNDDDLDGRLAAIAAARRGEAAADEGKRKPAPTAARADEDARRGKARGRRASAARGEEDLITSAETSRTRKTRRAERSLNWQQALLVVARDALPPLVENDDQANLATLVDTLKRHLDDGGRGPVDEELTTLYRAASAHLKTGARAYAENVGSSRRPILLGDVLVGRKYDVQPPLVDLTGRLREVGPMVFVPRRGDDPTITADDRWPARLGVAWTGARS
jgi:hypothetical protein